MGSSGRVPSLMSSNATTFSSLLHTTKSMRDCANCARPWGVIGLPIGLMTSVSRVYTKTWWSGRAAFRTRYSTFAGPCRKAPGRFGGHGTRRHAPAAATGGAATAA